MDTEPTWDSWKRDLAISKEDAKDRKLIDWLSESCRPNRIRRKKMEMKRKKEEERPVESGVRSGGERCLPKILKPGAGWGSGQNQQKRRRRKRRTVERVAAGLLTAWNSKFGFYWFRHLGPVGRQRLSGTQANTHTHRVSLRKKSGEEVSQSDSRFTIAVIIYDSVGTTRSRAI